MRSSSAAYCTLLSPSSGRTRSIAAPAHAARSSTTGRFADSVSLDNYSRSSPTRASRRSCCNTVLVGPRWCRCVATAFGLIYAVLVDRTRFETVAKALIFLPMAISLVGASHHLEVRLRLPAPARQHADRPAQPDHRAGSAGNPPVTGSPKPWNTFFLIVVMIWIQAGFAMTSCRPRSRRSRTTSSRRRGSTAPPAWQLFWSSPCRRIRPTLVVVLTTIAIASLKAFDIVRTMTGGNFGTQRRRQRLLHPDIRAGCSSVAGRGRARRDPVHHGHPGDRLQRSADAAFGGNAMSRSGPHRRTAHAARCHAGRALGAPPTQAQDSPAGRQDQALVAVGLRARHHLAVLWTIPTFGLFITSFRPRAEISTTGWWTSSPTRGSP